MRRYLLIGFLLWIGTAEAQRGSYFGVGASYYTTFAESYLYPSFRLAARSLSESCAGPSSPS